MPFDATPVEPQIVRDLQAARALIAEEGKWGRGRLCHQGRMCALGAIANASGLYVGGEQAVALWVAGKRSSPEGQRYWQAANALAGHMPDYTPEFRNEEDNPEFRVFRANDSSTTTHSMMLGYFDAAIQAERAKAHAV